MMTEIPKNTPPRIPVPQKTKDRIDFPILVLILSVMSILLFVFSERSFLLLIISLLFAMGSMIIAFKNFVIQKFMLIATMFSVVACSLGIINIAEWITTSIQNILYPPYEPYYSEGWEVGGYDEEFWPDDPSYWD